MAYVVTESCIKCVYTDCVSVCPVNCFRIGANFLVIDPEPCIDCALCVPECPVEAIMAEEDVPEHQLHFVRLNLELARAWPEINKARSPLPDAEDWKTVKDKVQYLER